MVCDPALDALAPEKRPSRITLSLHDGRQLSAYWPVALGDPSRPLTAAQLETKFLTLVGGQLGDTRARAIQQAVRDLAGQDTLGTLRACSELLETPA